MRLEVGAHLAIGGVARGDVDEPEAAQLDPEALGQRNRLDHASSRIGKALLRAACHSRRAATNPRRAKPPCVRVTGKRPTSPYPATRPTALRSAPQGSIAKRSNGLLSPGRRGGTRRSAERAGGRVRWGGA